MQYAMGKVARNLTPVPKLIPILVEFALTVLQGILLDATPMNKIARAAYSMTTLWYVSMQAVPLVILPNARRRST
jgi:hypothetical protein